MQAPNDHANNSIIFTELYRVLPRLEEIIHPLNLHFPWEDLNLPYRYLKNIHPEYDFLMGDVNSGLTPFWQIGPENFDVTGYGDNLILSGWIAILKLELKLLTEKE